MLQWHDNQSLHWQLAAEKHESDATELARQAEFRAHQAEITTLKVEHGRGIAIATVDRAHRKELNEANATIKALKTKLDEVKYNLIAPLFEFGILSFGPYPEADQVTPSAETSPQDVTHATGGQLPSPPAATESPSTEAEEASPTEIGTEQTEEDEEVEDESLTRVPTPEPSSLGEGAAQMPEDLEKDVAHSAPVPTEELAAPSQLTELDAAPGTATSDDGVADAPVATKVEPEVPIGGRETEEPTAVVVSNEVLGTTASDGAPMAPITNETEPREPVDDGPELPTAEESDQTPPSSDDDMPEEHEEEQAVHDEPANDLTPEEAEEIDEFAQAFAALSLRSQRMQVEEQGSSHPEEDGAFAIATTTRNWLLPVRARPPRYRLSSLLKVPLMISAKRQSCPRRRLLPMTWRSTMVMLLSTTWRSTTATLMPTIPMPGVSTQSKRRQ